MRIVEIGQQAEAGGEFRHARMTQHRAVRADHQRHVLFLRGELLDQTQRVFVAFVDDRVRMAVARQEALQHHEPGVTAVADQNRAARALFDQRHAPQNQRAHDALAQFGLGDDQRAQLVRRNQQSVDRVDSHAVDQRGPTGQLTDFSEKMLGAMFCNQNFAPDAIALVNLHAPTQHHKHAWAGVAGFEQQLTGFPVAHFAESAQTIDFRAGEFGEHLMHARRERRKRRVGDDGLLPFCFLSRQH
jgi:hypothetical protein